jgi:NAD(P) transhydrogenase subunit alpha
MLLKVVTACDVVISTAAIPGRKAPVLVTEEMVRGMAPGSVIVDLAAATGGNCELTEPDRTVVKHGVTIMGPTNLPASVPFHASQMYSKNITTFLQHLAKEGTVAFNMDDEITRETLVTRGGAIVHERVKAQVDAPRRAASPS